MTKQLMEQVETLMNEFKKLELEKRGLMKQYKQGVRSAEDRVIEIDRRLNEIDKLTSEMMREEPSQEEIDSHA